MPFDGDRSTVLTPSWNFRMLPGPRAAAVRHRMPEALPSQRPHKTQTLRKLSHKVIVGEAGLIMFPSAGCLIAILPWEQAHLHSWFVALIWILQLLHTNHYPGPSLGFCFNNTLSTTWTPVRPGASDVRFAFLFPLGQIWKVKKGKWKSC